jgi:hypothetical protein
VHKPVSAGPVTAPRGRHAAPDHLAELRASDEATSKIPTRTALPPALVVVLAAVVSFLAALAIMSR